jgi:predicted TIM-barrel fold metal-dependent hydrolase
MLQYAFAATTETVGALVNSGVFERHPNLQVAIVESTAGWLEWFMESADYYYDHRYSTHETLSLRAMMGVELLDLAPPSYYIKRNMKVCFMWDPVAIRRRKEIGIDVLMWGNDYPHPEGIWPNSRAQNEKQFAGVPEKDIMAIVHDNAAEFLNLTV